MLDHVNLYLGHLKAVRAEQKKGRVYLPQTRPKFSSTLYYFREIKSNLKGTTSLDSISEPSISYDENLTMNLPEWEHAYEHDGRSLESVLTFRPGNSWLVLREIGKNIKEGIKPYKSWYYALRDVFTPLRALYNLVMGSVQIVGALPVELVNALMGVIFPSSNESRFVNLSISVASFFLHIGEGLSRLALGLSLLVSTVFLPFKLFARGISTLVHESQQPLLIENNNKIKRLIEDGVSIIDTETTPSYAIISQGLTTLDNDNESQSVQEKKTPEVELPVKELSSLALDIHMQYKKHHDRYQKSAISPEIERQRYQDCVSRGVKDSFQQYFKLFKPQAKNQLSEKEAVIDISPIEVPMQ